MSLVVSAGRKGGGGGGGDKIMYNHFLLSRQFFSARTPTENLLL